MPDGARFLTIQDDCHVNVWGVGGSLEHSFGIGTHVQNVVAMPDGVHLAVGLWNGFVKIHHINGNLVHTLDARHSGYNPWADARYVQAEPHRFTKHVTALAVTPDGAHLIAGTGEFLVKVWSIASKSLVATSIPSASTHGDAVHALAPLPDGKRVLSASGRLDKSIILWLLDGTENLVKQRGFRFGEC